MAGFPPRGSAENYALAAFSALRARAAGKPNSQTGLIAAIRRMCIYLSTPRSVTDDRSADYRPFAAFAPRSGFEGLNEAGVFQLVISIFGGPQKSISPVQGDGGVLRPCAFRALPALKHGSAQVSRWGVCHDALWI